MQISQFIVNPFYENTYLLWTGKGGEAIVIDPGMIDERERQAFDAFIADNGLRLKLVALTHQHVDHILSAQYLAEKYGIDVAGCGRDNPLGQSLPEQARRFGLRCPTQPLAITSHIDGGHALTLGDDKIEVIAVPGHSAGGLAFYVPSLGAVLAGDSLFERSVGRTDLPGGDFDTLIRSIRSSLFALPDATVVYPGHGDPTTIGDERRLNPYLAQYC